MDWRRKHICDIASACKQIVDEAATSADKRQKFLVAFNLAKPLSSCPAAGGNAGVHMVLAAMCNLCNEFSLYHCNGRSSWQEECQLIRERIRV